MSCSQQPRAKDDVCVMDSMCEECERKGAALSCFRPADTPSVELPHGAMAKVWVEASTFLIMAAVRQRRSGFCHNPTWKAAKKSEYLHMGWILHPWKSKESSCSSLELLDLDAAIAGPCHQKLAFCDLVAAHRRSEGGMPLLPWPVSGNLRNSFGSSMEFHLSSRCFHLDQV